MNFIGKLFQQKIYKISKLLKNECRFLHMLVFRNLKKKTKKKQIGKKIISGFFIQILCEKIN